MKKRNGILLAVFLLALAIFAINYAGNREKDTEQPISMEFAPNALELCVTADDGYVFEWIQAPEGNGYLQIPAVDDETRSIVLDVSAIPVGKYDYLTFAMQKADDCVYLTCEILHQSDSQFIVEVSQKSTEKVDTYKFDY